jgi:hypothetical protein
MTNSQRKNPKNQHLFPFSDIVYTDTLKAEIQRQDGYPDPSIDSLLEYADTLYLHYDRVDPEWATEEIRSYLLSYVRVGLVADCVRQYRLYEKFEDASRICQTFAEYCQKIIGKSEWYVNKIIDAAKICLKLIKLGFQSPQVPVCEYQDRPLVRVYQKAAIVYEAAKKKYGTAIDDGYVPEGIEVPPTPDEVLVKSWNKVISNLPTHHITGNKIAEIVEENPDPPKKQKVYIRTSQGEKWERAALEAGMTPDDYLEALLDGKLDAETEVEAQPDSATESTDSNDDKISVNSLESKELNWLEDLE